MRVSFAKTATVQDIPEPISETARPVPAPRPRAKVRKPVTRWRWYFIVLLIVTSPVLYYIGQIAYSSMVVEAPGFLHQQRIAAYIPPAHEDYAVAGQRATVIFPDGSRRLAEVVDVPQVKRQIPISEPSYGNAQIGVLVRMSLVDDADKRSVRRMIEGLPVRVRFESRRDDDSSALLAELSSAWSRARDHLREWRAQAQQ
jgi:hypothetical protein